MRIQKLFAWALAASLPFAAVASQSPATKLEYIQSKVRVVSSANLTHIRRLQAINSLYDVMNDDRYSQYFGQEALVRQVKFTEAISFDLDNPESLESFGSLRGASLFVSPGGETLRVFKTRAESEEQTQRSIDAISSELKLQFPSLVVQRRDNLDQVVSTNESFLEVLQLVQGVLSAYQNRGALSDFTKIILNDTVARYENTEASTYKYRGIGGEERVLSITIGRDDNRVGDLLLGPSTLQQLLSIILDKGFQGVKGVLLDSSEILGAIANLDAFLTPANVERLRNGGVTKFDFRTNWQNSPELLTNGSLTLGVSADEINQVADLLFP